MTISKVRSGNTLSGIAARSSTGEKPAPRKYVDYTVKSGDTFSGIAAKHELSLAALKKLNPQVENINVIHPGQPLWQLLAPLARVSRSLR